MKLPQKTPSKRFYFFSSPERRGTNVSAAGTCHFQQVLIEKSNTQDADSCGEQFVIYKTVQKRVEKGEKYKDKYGNVIIEKTGGTRDVSTGEINNKETSSHLPYIRIEGAEVGRPGSYLDEYYYLDNYIEDGDYLLTIGTATPPEPWYFTGVFKTGAHNHGSIEVGTDIYGPEYTELMLDEANKYIRIDVENGMSLKSIKAKYPYYLFLDYNEDFNYNGKQYHLGTLTFNGKKVSQSELGKGDKTFNEIRLSNLITDVVNDKTNKYANQQLKPYNLKLSDGFEVLKTGTLEGEPILVSTISVEKIG